MKKLLLFLDDKLEELFLVSTLMFSVGLVFTQVVMRYVFHSSIFWSEELARYLFIWQAWIGASFATKHSRHLNIDFVSNICPKTLQTILYWVTHLIWLGFVLYFTHRSALLTSLIFSRRAVTAALQIRIGWVYLAVPVGCALMSFRLIQLMAYKSGLLKRGTA